MMSDQQKADAQVAGNKFKYQQDQIENLSKDLEDAQQRIKDQDDALSDQKEVGKNIQTSLMDIKAEADAIKQDVKAWQKDDVGVLAGLQKSVEDLQGQIKTLHENLNKEKDEDQL
jgi:predicted  nucleic acid-binding Zn-ribbon protein